MSNYATLPALVDERLAGGRVMVDLQALVANWHKLKAYAPHSETAAVVKANAYGLGIEPVVEALTKAGCSSYFVALPEEGVRVRKVAPDATVYVLGGLFKNAAGTYAEAGLVPVLGNREDLDQWAEFWRTRSARKPCAIHVDTGMNRLGLSFEAIKSYREDETTKHAVSPVLIMSHPACADTPGHELNDRQLERFRKVMGLFGENRYSLANSAGVIGHQAMHLDVNRPGIALYGGEAVNGLPNPMQPVVTLEGRIVQVRNAAPGEGVGYGATDRSQQARKLAVVALGYADGYLRSASGDGVPLRRAAEHEAGAEGWLDGYRVPVCGRVSMDLTTFDVSQVPDAVLERAEWIELFGSNVALDEVARACGTIGYELLTGLGARYSRIYR